ncbi:unnamed protein product [Cuscuta epithymum]|uniref:Ubiquitin-like domain-containing protein n=1 Tax=Cuscuta epithymum TaxID=186058 RepID=A0AAV0FVN7_9ASTE|nr:unnamed protein product [Cuscuta epithymum]CAH9139265.1 unnamed protein product [Cuscuta epithymum]
MYSIVEKDKSMSENPDELNMPGNPDGLNIKFRLIDGTDIGPTKFPLTAKVEELKAALLAQLPQEKQNRLIKENEVKLISGGKILENSKTVDDCKNQYASSEDVTMHVVINQIPQDKEEKVTKDPKQSRCRCVIL